MVWYTLLLKLITSLLIVTSGLVEISGKSVKKLKDYENLKSEISKIKPTTIQAKSYTPANTELEECPATDEDWNAAVKLPPTPDEQLCKCMVQSLACTAEESVKPKTIALHFGYICGEGGTDCTAISANGTSGVYGPYSMCSPIEQLSWAMNQYYNDQNQAASACDFDGDARKVSPKNSGTCDRLLRQAETLIEEAAEAADAAAAADPKSAEDEKKSSAVTINAPAVQFGSFKVGFAGLAAAGAAFMVLA